MATKTLGTTANNSLTALSFLHGIGGMTPADQATICNGILDDINPSHPKIPGAFSSNGLLYVPRRGVLRVFTGDYVGIDSQGWPILVSANSIANAAWTHS